MRIRNEKMFGEALAFRRKNYKITQKQLAVAAKVSPRTIYAIESGDTSVSFETVLRVLKNLGFSIELVLARDKPGGPKWM